MDDETLGREIETIRKHSLSFLLGYYSDAFIKGLKASWRECTDEQAEKILKEIFDKITRAGANILTDNV